MDLVRCPYCQLHAHTKYLYTEIVVCTYCKAPVVRNAATQVQVTLPAKPVEFNFDLIDKSFTYKDQHYKITGYIRYFYTQGYLYQWAAFSHNTHIWLCECVGNWFILSAENGYEQIDVASLRPNSSFRYKGNEYTVDELSLFYNYYMEGELPGFSYAQTKGMSIECSSQDKLIHINIFPDNQIEMYTGQNIRFKDLTINLQ